MKVKIIRFIIVSLLIITTIQCQIEAADTPGELGLFHYPHSHLYTQEQQQVRESMIGKLPESF